MSTEASSAPARQGGDDEYSSLQRSKKRFGDSLFSGISTVSAALILAILAAVAIFLAWQAIPAFSGNEAEDSSSLDTVRKLGFWNWALRLAFGTVWAALLAMLLAVPFSLGIALFLSHYAPKRLAKPFGYIIDLLAAIPSVIFGLWGLRVLAPAMSPLYAWLGENMGWFPLFDIMVEQGDGQTRSSLAAGGQNMATAAIVLALMITPIITSLSREVFQQTPRLHEEASLALGATRWEMIKQAVLPFGMPGIISAAMLGLGRALGETMAVTMILPGNPLYSFRILTGNANSDTIAATIAKQFPEAHDLGNSQLIAAGLVLFVITLVVNMLARWVVSSRKEFTGAK